MVFLVRNGGIKNEKGIAYFALMLAAFGVKADIVITGLVAPVAVGTAIAHRPPHRPVLALLTHTVPT